VSDDAPDDVDAPTDPLADADVRRVLGPDGRPLSGATVPPIPDDTLAGIYRDMRATRRFDERAVSLQRQGRIGTYPPSAGQEASAVAATHALADDDLISFQYREHGAVAARDLLDAYLPYWAGYEAGNAALAEAGFLPLNISVGSHLPHAVGAGMAFDYRDEGRIAVVHFGDGATSEGDFHEAMTFAGVFDAPVVFCCHNNGWAISVPRERQTAAPSLAAKATGYGVEGVRVDGMDPLACHAAVAEAVARARRGEGPTLIEAVEYRFGAHTTADDPTAYREAAAVERWRALDPIPRFEAFLRDTDRLDDDAVAAAASAAEERVAAAVDALAAVEPDPADLFGDAAAERPARLDRRRDALLSALRRHGEDAFRRES